MFLFITNVISACLNDIQFPLRFNMSNRSIPEGLPVYETNETLGDAICCDNRYQGYAESKYTFNQKDIDLFSYLNETGETTFYDSVCGIPLFIVPRNRSLDDFKTETMEHGWPSFHDSEIYIGPDGPNVFNVSNSSRMISRCGTSLGDNIPINGHNRYCLDLVCLSGNPSNTF